MHCGHRDRGRSRQPRRSARLPAQHRRPCCTQRSSRGAATSTPSTSPSASATRPVEVHSEAHLRKGLQLGLSGTAADGTAGATSSNAWLIATLRERVLRAGLTCKVLKLTPHPDEATEGPGEHEVQSGHMVTVLCIGASKNAGDAVSATRASQSLPQPTALPAPRCCNKCLKSPRIAKTEVRQGSPEGGALAPRRSQRLFWPLRRPQTPKGPLKASQMVSRP